MQVAADPPIDHEIWILPFEWFNETNEEAKKRLNSDLLVLTQTAQSGVKLARQIKLLGVMGDAYIKTGKNGKDYIIFKGYARARPNLAGTRYLTENPKVACFVVGSKDILMDAANATRVAVVAFVAIDIMRECLADKLSLARLGVNVASDIAQAMVATGVGIAAGAIAVGVLGAPAVLTFAIVIGVGFLAGMALSAIDSKLGLTERARVRMMAFEKDPNSMLYKFEHDAAAAGQRMAVLTHEAVDATRYETDRAWKSVTAMLREDRRALEALPSQFRLSSLW